MPAGKVCLLILASTVMWAASPSSVAEEVRQGRSLQSQGRFAEAEKTLREAVKHADALPDGIEVEIAALSNLASVEMDLARMDEAVRLYDRGLRILIRELGNDSPRVRYHRAVIAEVYLEAGEIAEAERLLRDTATRKTHAQDAGNALELDVLACVYAHKNKLAAAESAEREAIAIFETIHDADQPSLAIALSHLASFLESRKRPVEALVFAERALAILKSLRVPQPAMEAETEIGAAVIYARLHRTDDAEAATIAAIRTVEGFYGKDHPRTATMLIAQAAILRSIGRKEAARQAQGRGEAILARAGGGRQIGAVPVEALLP